MRFETEEIEMIISGKESIAATLAMILITYYIVVGAFIIYPSLRSEVGSLQDEISLYIDTLSTVEKGNAKIRIVGKAVQAVSIEYHDRGKAEDFDFPEDGWYAVVTYRYSGNTIKNAEIINTYPKDGVFSKRIFSPSDICVKKESNERYPVVIRC